MKIRYIVILYTVMIGAIIAFSLQRLRGISYQAVDVVAMNEKYQEIMNALKDGNGERELEVRYACEILPRTDGNYESKIMKAISEGKILLDYYKYDVPAGKIIFKGNASFFQNMRNQLTEGILFALLGMVVIGYIIMVLVYRQYIRPFRKLNRFAVEVAKGNLDVPLEMNKQNYFGAFTESFDIMREELKSARESAYQANISKKELVASLSHDVKTPVATIKATCEVMMIKESKSDVQEKIKIIEAKAEMINQLVGNMFHATLEELEVLKVQPQEMASSSITEMLEELKYYGEIQSSGEIPPCLLYADSLRLNQVIDNVINNAYKYGKTAVTVSFGEEQDSIWIEIRDTGGGVIEEEISLLTEKYYRGSNAANESGSGLGLYLAKRFMDGMGGGLECFYEQGFVVKLHLKKV